MTATISEYRRVACPRCQQLTPVLTWLALDVVAEPEFRARFRDGAEYFAPCPACREPILRTAGLLVLGMAAEAPLVLACPDEMLFDDDPVERCQPVVERARGALDKEGRELPAPVLLVPFDVLATALARDVDCDWLSPHAAVREVADAMGPDAGERYGIFLTDIEGSRPLRRVNAAIAAFRRSTSGAEFAAAIGDFPELLDGDVRAELEQVRSRAAEAGDDAAVQISTAQLGLLDDAAAGRLESAWAPYEAAMANIFSLRLEEGVTEMQRELDAALEAGQLAAAVGLGEQLIERTRELRLEREEAIAGIATANAYYERSDGDRADHLERSCSHYERALALLEDDESAEARLVRVDTMLNLGAAFAARVRGDRAANQERAIALQREVLRLTTREANGRSWAMAHTNLGLSLLEREQVIEDAEDDEDEGRQFTGEQLTEAIRHFEASLTWRSFDRDPLDWAYTQINLGLAHFRRAESDGDVDLAQAIEHYGNAIRGFGAAGQRAHEAQGMVNRAAARRALALLASTPSTRDDLLDEAEQDAQAAVQLSEQGVEGVRAGNCWYQLAQVLASRHGYSAATADAYRRTLSAFTPEREPYGCRNAGQELARLAADASDWPTAASAWTQAALGGAAAVDSRATRGGRFNEARENGNLFRWAAHARFMTGELARAVEMLELGRARELGTWLDRHVVDLGPLLHADPALHDRFFDLRHQLEAAERAGATVADLRQARLAEELSAIVARIRTLPGLDTFLVRPDVATLARSLSAGEMIAYPLTAPTGSAWLLMSRDADGEPRFTAIELPALTSTKAFEVLVRLDDAAGRAEGFLVEAAETGPGLDSEIGEISQVLGPQLMRPLADHLRDEGRRSVCIVPLGLLGLVPMHAVEWVGDDGEAVCLLDLADVTYAPSAYVRHVSRSRARDRAEFTRLLTIGNPLPHSDPLCHTEIEARMVSATLRVDAAEELLGREATKDAVLAALPRASHVHFACHGQAAGDPRAFDAALSLAHDQPVSAREILELDLSRARLIVASACETAVVTGFDVVDEALALSTIFLGAGAAGAIASLWSVDDYATSVLMSRFYEALVTTPDDPARALRIAQLWLRGLSAAEEASYASRRPALARQRANRRASRGPLDTAPGSAGFSAPSMWAAFVFTGA